MNATNYRGDDDHPLRKDLNALPRARASEDFEERLLRRIAELEERPERASRKTVSWFPQRVPAFALSAFALVLASVTVYYTMVERDVVPTQIPTLPPVAPTSPSNQSQATTPVPTEDRIEKPVAPQVRREQPQSATRIQMAQPAGADESARRMEKQREFLDHGLMKEVGQGATPARAIPGFERAETVRAAGFDVLGDSSRRADSLHIDSLHLHRDR